ncbi:DUF2169 family type VI secretion system accessory protein [Burkholderia pyrrocinia]
MKIVKPDTLGLLYRTLRLDGADWLSVGALALFPLQADTPAGPANLATEVELWRTAQSSLGDYIPLDEGFPKPAGEFLVYGLAYARARERGARTSVAVRARVGSASKERLIDVCDPAPLVDFHALPPSDRERARHLGSFDSRWQAKQWPHLPAGTHADYFHAAPLDQRIDAFWSGDEDIELLNMNAARPIITCKLPRLRARCFVERSVDGVARIDACSMRAETVWLFPDAECGIILYRATVAIDDEDGDDVARLIAGWESLDTSPLPVDAYVNPPVTENGYSPGAVAQAPPENIETPAISADANVDTDARNGANRESASNPEPPVPDLSELEKGAAELATQIDALLAEHGLTKTDIERLLPQHAAPADLSMDELTALANEFDAQAEQWRQQYGATGTDNDSRAAVVPLSTPAPTPEPHDATLADQLRRIDAQTRAMLEECGLSRLQLLAASQSRPELTGLANAFDVPGDPLDVEALAANLESLAIREPVESTDPTRSIEPIEPRQTPIVAQPDDAMRVFANPTRSSTNDTPLTAPPNKLTRDQVIERHANGLSFAGCDLSDLDLSSVALERADFSDAVLEGTRFVGSRLSRATFDRALLSQADFSDADLRDATFVNARAPGASFRTATLDRATLDRADFSGGDFTRASLADCRCTQAQFDASQMNEIKARGLEGDHASFVGCALDAASLPYVRLPHANFQYASLRGATLASAQGDGTEWHGAQASQVILRHATLRGSRADASSCFYQADLSGVKLDDANWDGADLRESNLCAATLDRASLSRAIACGAQLTLTCARHADLSKTDLSHADVRFANLFGASLRRAKLFGTRLQFSNLYGADCYGTVLGWAQVEGANVDRTLLTVPGRPELTCAY